MEMSEFMQAEAESESSPEELDVQKAVVESLAADKAEQDEQIASLRKENYALKSKISELTEKIDELKASLTKTGDVLAQNAEGELSNKIALLDRDIELADRFPGETHDHVIEVIKEARERAEAEGRLRRAQILESVLLVNQASGALAAKRASLEKLFNDNQNILSGPVINELDNLGIQYKHGENYLLPAEILKRTY